MGANSKDGGKTVSLSRAIGICPNFVLWLFIFGVICLLIGLVNLYLVFNFPPLDSNPPLDFLFGYFGWLYNWNSYLLKAAVFLLISITIFLKIIYVKHAKS